jgi:hypothetical protein
MDDAMRNEQAPSKVSRGFTVSVFFAVSVKILRKLFICKGGCFSGPETEKLIF